MLTKLNVPKFSGRHVCANSVDPDQTDLAGLANGVDPYQTKEKSDQGPHCFPFGLHFLKLYFTEKPPHFRVYCNVISV